MFNVEIYSNFEHLVAPSTQEAIDQACVNCGAKKANLRWANENTDDEQIYDVYDERGVYVFSIDTDGDVIFDR